MIGKKIINKKNKGFTLVEMLVSVSVFTVVTLFTIGAVLSIFDANRKSQTLRTVMDNLNFTMESMTRTIRFGTKYHCDITQGDITVPRDCNTPASSIAVLDSDGNRVIFKLVSGQIQRSVDAGATFYPVTSSDMTVTNLSYWVFGSNPYSSGADSLQPKVILVINGFAGSKPTTQSTFTLETTLSQRVIDF